MKPDEKQAFVDRVQAEQASFIHSLRTIHSAAENRMLTRVAIARSGGTGEDDADDASFAK
jgi:tellurite resistance protein